MINAVVGKSMNDSMRVFNSFYPVAVARLFQYFLDNIAAKAGMNPLSMELDVVVHNFAMWIVFVSKAIGADPVLFEFQRHCRLVLVLAVYNVSWEAMRGANHDLLIDIMHWIMPIVCQGPFSQYRSVVVDSLAYYHRASEAERFLYKQSLTVNHTGDLWGNAATGKVQVGLVLSLVFFNISPQEYLNKKTKEAKRRDPTHNNGAGVGAETALLQHDRDVEQTLHGIFSHLHDPSEGVLKPPDPKTVLQLAKMAHWTALGLAVEGKDASLQKALFGNAANLVVAEQVIRKIRRAKQFGLDEDKTTSNAENDSSDSGEAK